MTRAVRRITAAALLFALTGATTGCFGSFVLVRKLHGFNQSFGNKFVQTLVFWVMVILPIYEFAALGDALVLNLIEFWTGSNPLAMNENETRQQVVEAEGQRAVITYAEQGRSVRIEVSAPGQAPRVFQFHGSEEAAEVRDGEGRVLAAGRRTAEGGVEVVDGRGALLDQRAACQVASLGRALEQSPQVFSLELHAGGAQLASR